jgi:hypothetical protein
VGFLSRGGWWWSRARAPNISGISRLATKKLPDRWKKKFGWANVARPGAVFGRAVAVAVPAGNEGEKFSSSTCVSVSRPTDRATESAAAETDRPTTRVAKTNWLKSFRFGTPRARGRR